MAEPSTQPSPEMPTKPVIWLPAPDPLSAGRAEFGPALAAILSAHGMPVVLTDTPDARLARALGVQSVARGPELIAQLAMHGVALAVPALGADLSRLLARPVLVVQGAPSPAEADARAAVLFDAGAPSSALVIAGRNGRPAPYLDGVTHIAGYRPGAPLGSVPDADLEPKCYGVMLQEPTDWTLSDPSVLPALWEEALRPRHRRAPTLVARLLAGIVLAHASEASTIMRGLGLAHRVIVNGSAAIKLAALRL